MKHLLNISRKRNIFKGIKERGEIIAACRAVLTAACGEKYSNIEAECAGKGAAGIQAELLFTDDETVKEYNSAYRHIDRTTDVLSFPFFEFENGATEIELTDIDPETGLVDLGNIMISLPKAISQAEEYGHSLKREIAFLTAHSCLHLLGYDHMSDGDAGRMERLQEEILSELGITRDMEQNGI